MPFWRNFSFKIRHQCFPGELLILRPDPDACLVITDRFAPGYVGLTGEKELKILFEQGMPALTKNGVLGDPRKASAAKGKIYLDRLTEFLIKEIKKQSH